MTHATSSRGTSTSTNVKLSSIQRVCPTTKEPLRLQPTAAGQLGPVDHFWSLSVEEQFYWVWPLVCAALRRWPVARPWPICSDWKALWPRLLVR